MSERIETLKKARERMADDRDAFAKTLAAPFDRDKAERARLKFIETQVLIDAIDRAIEGEQAADPSPRKRAPALEPVADHDQRALRTLGRFGMSDGRRLKTGGWLSWVIASSASRNCLPASVICHPSSSRST